MKKHTRIELKKGGKAKKTTTKHTKQSAILCRANLVNYMEVR